MIMFVFEKYLFFVFQSYKYLILVNFIYKVENRWNLAKRIKKRAQKDPKESTQYLTQQLAAHTSLPFLQACISAIENP